VVVIEGWQPTCPRPTGLIVPVRLDPTGRTGPTRSAARHGRWQQVASGWYLPAEADVGIVEQRILAGAARLPEGAGVTAWAALRWRGAAYFTGIGPDDAALPIPLLLSIGNLRPDPRVHLSKEQFAPAEREVVAGLPCAAVERALFDEVRRLRGGRLGVTAIDMTAAAGLITVVGFASYVSTRPAWTHVPKVRRCLPLAHDDARSPQEVLMRLVWVIDAGLPDPLCNRPVFGLEGSLLGVPDLFDEQAGVVGEYDGADHRRLDRRRKDASREERFRDHGLEYFRVVEGEVGRRASLAARMDAVRRRARFLPPDQRRWTLDEPDWYRLRRTG
jgi:hypothetical protein